MDQGLSFQGRKDVIGDAITEALLQVVADGLTTAKWNDFGRLSML
jgi:hypothetical protein